LKWCKVIAQSNQQLGWAEPAQLLAFAYIDFLLVKRLRAVATHSQFDIFFIYQEETKENKSVGKLIYGTQTGTTVAVAEAIQKQLADLVSEIKCIDKASTADFSDDFLVLGGSTWGDGELTDDWADFWPQMDNIDFAGKKVALFALGDQVGYGYNFVSSMKFFYDKVIERGASVIANQVTRDGFDFEHTEALVDGYFVGLVLDEVNEPHLSDDRIALWAQEVRNALLVTA
jgi:flavodoxin I